jgi:NTP pyrophosphatase (non-canonical NTP hydrolase)
MDAIEYLRDSARTASGEFHAEIVNPAEVDFMLQAVIAAGGWADRLKRALFYGKKLGPSRWGTTSVSLKPELADLVHAMFGCVTESAEIAVHVRDVLTGAKPLDGVNLKEEFGDTLWYVALGLRFLQTDFGETFATNIAKLRKRFPDKFTERAAIDRDLAGERAVLEALPSPAASTGQFMAVEKSHYEALIDAVRFFSSVIKSGEGWTDHCEQAKAAALNPGMAVLEQSSGTDPVHQDGAWYFWDETWADRNGPFAEEATARAELKRYCEYLDNGPAAEPEPGSYWEHTSGTVYQVLFLANLHNNPRYPRTVIYRGPNGNIWSRRADDWHRSMSPIVLSQEPVAAEAQAELPSL